MAKPVNVMRGDPVLMPLARCQWFDHVVRFSFSRPNTASPPLISFTARLLRTCVNRRRNSLLYSRFVPVAAGLLWGNVASGLTGALAALVGSVPLAECHEAGLVLLDHGPLRGSGQLDVRAGRLRFRRRSCCLFYRLPGGGTCGDCPLRPGATVS